MGLPIFATETGVCDSHGNGTVNVNVSQAWWSLLDTNKISYMEFGLADYYNNCVSLLKYPTPPEQAGNSSDFTDSGVFVNKKLWSTDQNIVCTAG
uniref:Uncharacterized protein n=1 Tax=Acrobeloides nanus TaxID=290746 RepID=A0A914DEU3_9BILA